MIDYVNEYANEIVKLFKVEERVDSNHMLLAVKLEEERRHEEEKEEKKEERRIK